MDWNQLFLKKEEWQRNTFERIKDDLISAKDNRWVKYDNSKENHLVMIYGKSQIGKTTLILNLIGIKDEYFNEVYGILRAGVPRGNSSTSTAIIYSKSSNGSFGLSIATATYSLKKNVVYYNKEEIIEHLKAIRNDVENNRVNSDSILFIYIPEYYFIQDATVNSISIMDMPGVESRNKKEEQHVRDLMTKYIPISSVCIIACKAENIQSLETIELPKEIDWKIMEHRFMLVLTNSYNNGSIKNYFTKHRRSERKIGFYDYIKEIYTTEIRKVLGKNNKIEVYPIDIGDTLNKLITSETEYKPQDRKSDKESDRKEIIETRDKVLAEIRSSIVNRKGERLKAALEDLKSIIDHYGEYDLKYIDGEISSLKERINDKNIKINELNKNIKKLSDEDSEKLEIESSKSELLSFKSDFTNLIDYGLSGNLYLDIEKYIIDNNLYRENSNGNYLKDNKKLILDYIRDYTYNNVETFVSKIKALQKKADADIVLSINETNITNITSQIDFYILVKENELYPPKQGFFSKKEKIYFDTLKSICSSIQDYTNILLNKCVNKYIERLDSCIREKEMRLKSILLSIDSKKKNIRKYNDEIRDHREKILGQEQKRNDISKKKQQDQHTLDMYLKYANEEYLEQRNSIIKQIKLSYSSYDKMLLILFLGLLDKDYEKVTGGIDENSNRYAIEK